MTADALTATPSDAELWIAYHRKSIIASASVLLAGVSVLHDATGDGAGFHVTTLVAALLACGQVSGTYFPGDAITKLISSGVFAFGSAILAATAHLTSASILLVVVQILTWVAAGAAENGPDPDVARAALRGGSTLYNGPALDGEA